MKKVLAAEDWFRKHPGGAITMGLKLHLECGHVELRARRSIPARLKCSSCAR